LSPRPPRRSWIATSLQRHPLAWFFALAFGISWGGILVIAAARGFDLSPLQPVEGGLIFLMMLLGPSLSGLICTALTDGRAGFRALRRSALRWRVAPQWPLLAVGFVAGSFEEIGWTGFASTRLLERHGLGQAGLTLGLVWAFWHLLADVR